MAKILDLHSGDPRSIRGGSMLFYRRQKDDLVKRIKIKEKQNGKKPL